MRHRDLESMTAIAEFLRDKELAALAQISEEREGLVARRQDLQAQREKALKRGLATPQDAVWAARYADLISSQLSNLDHEIETLDTAYETCRRTAAKAFGRAENIKHIAALKHAEDLKRKAKVQAAS